MIIQTKIPTIGTALISVSDKTGIVDFAKQLVACGITILSTGGSAKLLQKNNVPVTQISDYTGSPEIMTGRVKTLHPKVHGGILARRGKDDAVMQEMGMTGIDLVVVNLYPFQSVTAQPDCTLSNAIEHIDIGGPTMVRAAAKNHQHVGVLVDQGDYDTVLAEIKEHGGLTSSTRATLACKAFSHTAQYDVAISTYLTEHMDGQTGEDHALPTIYQPTYIKQQVLRYGENPHQKAAFYQEAGGDKKQANVAHADLLQGKALSFNNIADADSAFACVKSFDAQVPACVIVKHANPCGVAMDHTLTAAYERAFMTDKTSAFGGIIAFNQVLDVDTASAILHNQFCEVIIAPDVTDKAKNVLSQKPNIRVLMTGNINPIATGALTLDYKKVEGGLLVQTADVVPDRPKQFDVVSKRTPTEVEYRDLLFSWQVAKYVKSNAIVYARDNATVGVGAGQMSRIDSALIAGKKAIDAGLPVEGAVMGSDAFFPFRDGIDAAAKAGITAIIQPGGSIRDNEVIQAADEANIAMVFTHKRHFRHA